MRRLVEDSWGSLLGAHLGQDMELSCQGEEARAPGKEAQGTALEYAGGGWSREGMDDAVLWALLCGAGTGTDRCQWPTQGH